MKVAVHQRDRLRIEEVRLPENLVDENGNILLPNAFAAFLKNARRELVLPRGAAALVLPSSQVICRLVTMPRMTTEQLLLNLPYEFSDFIRGVPDQYYCDYAVCAPLESEDESSGISMMAAVAGKQKLAEYSRIFARAGIGLKSVLPQEMALIGLVQAQRDPEGEFCFVDLGHQYTRITVILGDRVQATRQIALGGRNLDMAVAQELGTDLFRANNYKLRNHKNVLAAPSVRDICESIAVEILKVVNFYQFTYRSGNLRGIYLAGGGALLEPLRQAIGNTVELDIPDLSELLPGTGEEAAAGLFAAGAAMGGK